MLSISIQRCLTAPHPSRDKFQCTRLYWRLSTVTTQPSTPYTTSFTNTFSPDYSQCFPDSEFGVRYSQYLEKLSVPCAYPILPINCGPPSPWGLTTGLYSSGWSRVACSTGSMQLTPHTAHSPRSATPKLVCTQKDKCTTNKLGYQIAIELESCNPYSQLSYFFYSGSVIHGSQPGTGLQPTF